MLYKYRVVMISIQIARLGAICTGMARLTLQIDLLVLQGSKPLNLIRQHGHFLKLTCDMRHIDMGNDI